MRSSNWYNAILGRSSERYVYCCTHIILTIHLSRNDNIPIVASLIKVGIGSLLRAKAEGTQSSYLIVGISVFRSGSLFYCVPATLRRSHTEDLQYGRARLAVCNVLSSICNLSQLGTTLFGYPLGKLPLI